MKKMSFVVAVVVTAALAITACGKKKGAETPATGSGSAMGSDTGSAAGSGETPAAGSGEAAGSAAM